MARDVQLQKQCISGSAAACSTLPQAKSIATPPAASDTMVSNLNQALPAEDGLTQYPTWSSAQGVLRGVTYGGTVVFALSGCITAGNVGMDLLGCIIVGTTTAVGGGTVRDLLIGNTPVFWMRETEYIWISLGVSTGAFFTWSYLTEQGLRDDSEVLMWADALGVGAACVVGAQGAVRKALPTSICIISGMITATFGGLLRDFFCQKPARILHSQAEIYASTAVVGAGAYMAMKALKLSPVIRILAGCGLAVGLRVAAWRLNIRLPTWEGLRSSRSPPEEAGLDGGLPARRAPPASIIVTV